MLTKRSPSVDSGLGDDGGREVDVHVVDFDSEGNGLYGPAEKGEMFPAASLSGTGTIGGHAVRCISAEYLVKWRTGYELHDSDYHDVSALCERFGIELPASTGSPETQDESYTGIVRPAFFRRASAISRLGVLTNLAPISSMT